MEAFVIILILLAALLYFRKFSNFVYALAITDIFLRILNFAKLNLGISEISAFISKYFPDNIPMVITKYTNGILSDILIWVYVILFAIFEFYIVRAFFKNKKL